MKTIDELKVELAEADELTDVTSLAVREAEYDLEAARSRYDEAEEANDEAFSARAKIKKAIRALESELVAFEETIRALGSENDLTLSADRDKVTT